MNEHDEHLIQMLNDHMDHFAQALSSEARIKRQQQNFLEKGRPSIEAEKIKTLFADINLEKIMEKELRDYIKKVLELKISKENMLSVEERAKYQREMEKFNTGFEEYQKQDAKQLLADLLKAHIKALGDIIAQWEQFIKEMKEQLQKLKEQYQKYIIELMYPLLDKMKQNLIDEYRAHPPLPHAEVDYQLLLNSVFDKIKHALHDEILTPSLFAEAMWGGKPYVKGVLMSAIDEVAPELTDADKHILKSNLWTKIGNNAEFHAGICSLAEQQQAISKAPGMIVTATSTVESLAKEKAEYQERLAKIETMSPSEAQTHYKEVQASERILPHIIHQAKGFMDSMRQFFHSQMSPRVEQGAVMRQDAVSEPATVNESDLRRPPPKPM